MGRSGLTRREFLAALGAGAVGVACTGSSPAPRAARPTGTIASIVAGATTVSVIGTGSDAPPLGPGRSRFGFDLVTVRNELIQGGAPKVWVATGPRAPAAGPFPATWHPFTAYGPTGDRSPRAPLTGNYAAEIVLPRAGYWTVGVIAEQGGRRFAGTGILQVSPAPAGPAPGSRAVSTPTPVASTVAGIEAICTRTPVDRMHAISLDRALTNGRPTVVSFATPLLCQTRLCGPVVDEQILVSERYGPDRANFIHVEEFLPGPSHRPPPATFANRSPAFKAWKLDTEPWMFVIDATGVIRFAALGPVTAPEIEAALRPLLA